MSRFVDFTGAVFGKQVVLEDKKERTDNGHYVCSVRCQCGNVRKVRKVHLKSGNSTQCLSCAAKDSYIQQEDAPVVRTHGKSTTKEYQIWCRMKRRCNEKTSVQYKWYGARGIKICPRWESFSLFFEDMGKCPDGYSIERIDNNKGYSPENCRWASQQDQCNNRRNNHIVFAFGDSLTIAEWARDKRCHVSVRCLYNRIRRGWNPEAALTKQQKDKNNRWKWADESEG